jgi:hypothetical protein
VTTWSVVKDDTRERSRPASYFRFALAAFTAFLVLSLGFALIPREAPRPAAPPFSEQARASALAETMRLRAASLQLAEDASGAQRQIYSRTVTLLTTQARALILPADETAAAASAAPSPSGSGTAVPATAAPATVPALVAGLSASGRERLAHAETADGGMARLLSVVGTAQLLQAAVLAQASGTPVPALPAAPAPLANPTVTCPRAGDSAPGDIAPGAGSPGAASAEPGTASGPPAAASAPAPGTAPLSGTAAASGEATQADALQRAVRTEVETVYGYQVALTRLDGHPAQQAKTLLTSHEARVDEAETHSRLHCVQIPPREPGYTLDTSFLKNPAAGLASLEAGTLPVYGDLVALSEGPTRKWAIASLLAATQRSIGWGSDPGPVPGLVLDTSQLPTLPEAAPSSPADLPSPS